MTDFRRAAHALFATLLGVGVLVASVACIFRIDGATVPYLALVIHTVLVALPLAALVIQTDRRSRRRHRR